MKFASLAAAALPLAPAFAQTTPLTLTYDPRFDDASLPMTDVACSDGPNGFITKGLDTLGSLTPFPNVGGVYTVTGWDSPECGTCYEVTYGGDSMIQILAVDTAPAGFTVSKEAMDALTGGQANILGRVDVMSVQVDAAACRPVIIF